MVLQDFSREPNKCDTKRLNRWNVLEPNSHSQNSKNKSKGQTSTQDTSPMWTPNLEGRPLSYGCTLSLQKHFNRYFVVLRHGSTNILATPTEIEHHHPKQQARAAQLA